jgi:hypothetical protein
MDIATTDLGASFAMPFSPKGTSQVNFFGIKSQGRRVAFLIDAERYMLTDPRGGYPAYEIVKNEIAGMIGKLGLETYFNVILYEGSAVSAYSDKLIPATTANKDKIRDWLYPVNREFEKLGIRPIGYPVQSVQQRGGAGANAVFQRLPARDPVCAGDRCGCGLHHLQRFSQHDDPP